MTYQFAVYGPSTSGARIVISRHLTRKAAERALKLAKGDPRFEVAPL